MKKIYNRDGHLITMAEWTMLKLNREYNKVAQEQVGKYLVSTVWLGLDHALSPNDPPAIFETMVFENGVDEFQDLFMQRYPNEVAALAGHDLAVAWAREHS
jgi:hypothetical protein